MSTISRKTRAAHAQPGTIAADRRIEIKDVPESPLTSERPPSNWVDPADVFGEEDLATMPVRVRQSESDRVTVWRASSGRWYRHGGHLRIQPCRDGVRRYVIMLAKGANEGDLDLLLDQVKRVRAGERGAVWVKRDQDWASWVDDRTFTLATSSRRYVDPHLSIDSSPPVSVCSEPLCREQWHVEYDAHLLDDVVRTLPNHRGGYTIRVRRCLDEPTWTVDIYTSEFYGTPDDVAGFVSDLQWMQAECRRANDCQTVEVVAA